MSSLYRHAALTVLVVSILSGCSSSVTREPVAQSDRTSTNAQAQFGTQPVAVRVTLSPKVENELADNAGFSAQKLQSAFESELNTRQLLATPTSSAAMRLNVEVSDIRVRGTGTALFWGFLSGDDHITGNVTVLDASGQPVDKLDVSAAYAADGIVGVAGEGRMAYLYNTFAKKALSALESPK